MPESVNPRLLTTGDIVTTEWGEQVVRDVLINVRLANGVDWVVDPSTTTVERVPPQAAMNPEEMRLYEQMNAEQPGLPQDEEAETPDDMRGNDGRVDSVEGEGSHP